MSLLVDLKSEFLSEALRTAINAALDAVGVPTIPQAFVAHTDLLAEEAYTPRWPALAVMLNTERGERLATDDDYRHTVTVTLTLAVVHSVEAQALDWCLKAIDAIRKAVMTELRWTFDRLRYVGSEPEGKLLGNEQGTLVTRQVPIRFEVRANGLVRE